MKQSVIDKLLKYNSRQVIDILDKAYQRQKIEKCQKTDYFIAYSKLKNSLAAKIQPPGATEQNLITLFT